jgi:RNA polymerase sigma factor (sigma-70 family)
MTPDIPSMSCDDELWERVRGGDSAAFGVLFQRHADGLYNFRAWLFGIAKNVLRNRWRSERRYRAALARSPREASESAFAADADSRLDDEQLMRRVLGGLRRLPKREQDVLVLCVWSELTYEEASLALGIPVGTVRSRLSRARQRLRELAEVDGHEINDHATPETSEV